MNQKLAPLNQNELLWVQAQLENASQFVERFSGAPLTLSALDRAFTAWLASDPPGGAGRELLAFQFGFFGNFGIPGNCFLEVLIYPANFVAKRWERRETDFLEDSFRHIAHDVRAVAANWERSK